MIIRLCWVQCWGLTVPKSRRFFTWLWNKSDSGKTSHYSHAPLMRPVVRRRIVSPLLLDILIPVGRDERTLNGKAKQKHFITNRNKTWLYMTSLRTIIIYCTSHYIAKEIASKGMIDADFIQQINCNASGLSVHIVHDYKLFHNNTLHMEIMQLTNCWLSI